MLNTAAGTTTTTPMALLKLRESIGLQKTHIKPTTVARNPVPFGLSVELDKQKSRGARPAIEKPKN